MREPGGRLHADGKPRLRPWVMAPCKTGWALALLVLLHALPALHASPAPRDTLVVGGDAGYAPFQMLDDDGQASGFDVELLRLLARDLGMDVRFELGGWDEALARLERHEVDVVPMFTSDRRGSRFLFTRPYLLRYHGVFGREGRPEVARLDALHPYTVAVQDHGRAWEALEQLEPGPGLVLVRTEPQALRAVAQGKADYALVPTGVGLHTINRERLRGLVPLGPPLLEQTYALAVRSDRPELAQALDEALVRVRDSGAQDRLYRHWLGQIGAAREPGNRLAWAWWLLPVALLGAGFAWMRHRRRPPDPSSASRLLVDLRLAIANGSLGYAVQPKQDLRTGLWTGGEMLVRWNHPERGPLAPGDFLPLAEFHGEMGALDLYMIRRAMEQLQAWPAMDPQPTLSVNIGANDLADRALVDRIIELTGDRGHALILEVTETDIMHAPDLVADALPRLRRHGIRISLDDFGTGHSSLTHLRRLAPEEIKIDRSFVTTALESSSDRAILRATIHLAHEVGAVVTAEGIEDEETLRWLREAGCDIAQGFGVCRPIPPEEFASMLRAQGSAPPDA